MLYHEGDYQLRGMSPLVLFNLPRHEMADKWFKVGGHSSFIGL